MLPRQCYMLGLKIQRNLSNLLTIALQSSLSKKASILRETLCNCVASNTIDLVQDRWLIAELLTHLLQRGWRIFCTVYRLLKQVKDSLSVDSGSSS